MVYVSGKYQMISLVGLGISGALLYLTVFSLVLWLSHSPRKREPSELLYYTNDDGGKTYKLPKTTDSTARTSESEEIELSVVVPCYNETKRLGKMLEECVSFLNENYPSKYEILIVDDGSKDGSDKLAIRKANELCLKPHTLRVVKLVKNRGKGGAVTHGLLHTRGKYALFADADGATKFSDVERLLAPMRKAPNGVPMVAVGSRAHMVDTDAVVKRSFIRNFLMYCLHTLVYVFGIHDIKDTQCGFKIFNQTSVSMIFPHMHTERWIFDVEVLMIGKMQNIAIKEVPVNWQEVDGSKIDIARDSIEMAIDLVITRLAYIIGVYKLNQCGNKASLDKKKNI